MNIEICLIKDLLIINYYIDNLNMSNSIDYYFLKKHLKGNKFKLNLKPKYSKTLKKSFYFKNIAKFLSEDDLFELYYTCKRFKAFIKEEVVLENQVLKSSLKKMKKKNNLKNNKTFSFFFFNITQTDNTDNEHSKLDTKDNDTKINESYINIKYFNYYARIYCSHIYFKYKEYMNNISDYKLIKSNEANSMFKININKNSLKDIDKNSNAYSECDIKKLNELDNIIRNYDLKDSKKINYNLDNTNTNNNNNNNNNLFKDSNSHEYKIIKEKQLINYKKNAFKNNKYIDTKNIKIIDRATFFIPEIEDINCNDFEYTTNKIKTTNTKLKNNLNCNNKINKEVLCYKNNSNVNSKFNNNVKYSYYSDTSNNDSISEFIKNKKNELTVNMYKKHVNINSVESFYNNPTTNVDYNEYINYNNYLIKRENELFNSYKFYYNKHITSNETKEFFEKNNKNTGIDKILLNMVENDTSFYNKDFEYKNIHKNSINYKFKDYLSNKIAGTAYSLSIDNIRNKLGLFLIRHWYSNTITKRNNLAIRITDKYKNS